MSNKAYIGGRYWWLVGGVLLLLLSSTGCRRDRGARFYEAIHKAIQWEWVDLSEHYIAPVDLQGLMDVESDEQPQFQLHLQLLKPTTQSDKYGEVIATLHDALLRRLPLIGSYGGDTLGVFENYLQAYIKEQLSDYKEGLNLAQEMVYEPEAARLRAFSKYLDIRDSLVYDDKGILSLLMISEDDSGGVHPNEMVSSFNFDLVTGEQLTVSSVFQDDYSKQLGDLILQRLLEQFNVASVEELEELGFFFNDGLKVAENFYFSEAGVVFHYNPYELAAFSVGAIDLLVSYADLKSYLTPTYQRLATD